MNIYRIKTLIRRDNMLGNKYFYVGTKRDLINLNALDYHKIFDLSNFIPKNEGAIKILNTVGEDIGFSFRKPSQKTPRVNSLGEVFAKNLVSTKNMKFLTMFVDLELRKGIDLNGYTLLNVDIMKVKEVEKEFKLIELDN